MCDSDVSLEYLFQRACKLWEDGWTFLPLFLTDVSSEESIESIESIESFGSFQYRVTIRGERGYVMDENPVTVMEKAIERWG